MTRKYLTKCVYVVLKDGKREWLREQPISPTLIHEKNWHKQLASAKLQESSACTLPLYSLRNCDATFDRNQIVRKFIRADDRRESPRTVLTRGVRPGRTQEDGVCARLIKDVYIAKLCSGKSSYLPPSSARRHSSRTSGLIIC